MNVTDWIKIHEYCMEKSCAYETRPFGEFPICYRVAGKIFAQLTPKKDWFKITLKTNPEAADVYRRMYPGIVVRGYHCPPVQQPYWNTINLEEFEFDCLYQMIDEAYEETVRRLTKKEQGKLPLLANLQFVKTDGKNEDFIRLCECLDENLEELAGAKIERKKYAKYNQLDSIHDVIVVYRDGQPIGGGAYKFYDDETAELKRIFVDKSYRGIGVGKELLRRLEADARIAGYRYAILETGELLTESTALYKRMGYRQIPNYGQYIDMPESLCMGRKL